MNQTLRILAATALVAASATSQCFREVDATHTNLGGGDDTLKAIQSLGILFPMAGTSYADIHISTNGLAYLSNAGTPAPGTANGAGGGGYGSAATQLTTLLGGPPKICAFYRDLNLTVANGGNVFFKPGAGSSPAIITWQNAVDFGGVPGAVKTIQAQLFATGEVMYFYTPSTNVFGTAPATVGQSPAAGAPNPGQSDLSSSPVVAVDTIYEQFVTGTFDLANNSVRFLPTTPGWLAVVGGLTPAGCASTAPFGTGCYPGAFTFYELFTGLSAFDFTGAAGAETVLQGIAAPGGYLITNAPSAWRAPTAPKVLNNAATPAAMTDDSFSQPLTLPFAFPFPRGSANVVHASSNGFLLLAPTTSNASDFTPTALELVTGPPTLNAMWCDLQPAINVTTNPASGVYFDVDPSNTAVYITWLDVADRRGAVPAAGATSVNLQIVLYNTGNFEFRYGVVTPGTGTGAVMTGFSPGNVGGSPSADPGGVDLSASLPLATNGPGSLLHSTTPPILGTTMTFRVEQTENLVPLAIVFVGDTAVSAGLPLAAIGAPGCNGYTNGNLASAGFPVSNGAGTLPLALPSLASLAGLTLVSQVVSFSTKNPLGLTTSNGVSWTLGN